MIQCCFCGDSVKESDVISVKSSEAYVSWCADCANKDQLYSALTKEFITNINGSLEGFYALLSVIENRDIEVSCNKIHWFRENQK